MKAEELVDWRVAKAARVQQVHNQPPGGNIEPGDIAYLNTLTRDSRLGLVNFITPSPAALALSVAIKSAKQAVELRRSVSFDLAAPGARERFATPEELPRLFDYFEQCMIAVVFSFQSLELFSNQVISDFLQGTFPLERKGTTTECSPAEVERLASTDEKLSLVLPHLLSVQTPKGRKPWDEFRKLKGIRDATVHLKSADHYVRGRVDTDTVYHQFLNTVATTFPRQALVMMRHFVSGESASWLDAAEKLLSTTPPPAV